MKTLERILTILILIATFLFLNQLPAAAIIYTLSALILGCLYFPFGFAFFNNIPFKGILKKESYNEIKRGQIIGAILAGFLFSIACTGILFRILFLPGASFLYTLCSIPLVILFITGLTIYLKSRSVYSFRVFTRALIIGVIATVFHFEPLLFMKIKYKDYPNYIRLYEEYLEYPENGEELYKAIRIEEDRIRKIEKK
jgi:hypothetical protein